MVGMSLRGLERQFVVDEKDYSSLIFWWVILNGRLEG